MNRHLEPFPRTALQKVRWRCNIFFGNRREFCPNFAICELYDSDADYLVKHGVTSLFEGANMPSTPKVIEVFKASGGAYFPVKAANAGGVAVSGLKMA